jgi:Flp pilus assembly protein TadG
MTDLAKAPTKVNEVRRMHANRFRFPVFCSNRRKISRSFRHGRGESGAEVVEFALVMMGLFLVLFGIMGFGQALYAYHFVSHAAREGARFAIVRGSSCITWTTACPASPTDVQNYVVSISPPGISTSSTDLTVTTTWPGVAAGTACPANGTPGCPVNVQIQYKFHFIFPLLSSSGVTMTSASQMVISQ